MVFHLEAFLSKEIKMLNLGYACINMNLSSLKEKVSTNRTMRKATFQNKGLDYVSEIVLLNVSDLKKILEWNMENDIFFFRISSEIFPWASEYELSQLKDFDEIQKTLKDCGDFATKNGIRLTYHPGPFNKLCSSDERILSNTIKNLEHHSEIFDIMGLTNTAYNKINIHVGAAYNDREGTAEVFCKNFERLSDNLKNRLTVENDDRDSMYSTLELYNMIYKKIGIPIVHDIHHHSFCNRGAGQEESLLAAIETWGKIKPVVHYSESRTIEYGEKVKPNAHSDLIYSEIELFGNDVDVMIEAKKKELALLGYRKKFM